MKPADFTSPNVVVRKDQLNTGQRGRRQGVEGQDASSPDRRHRERRVQELGPGIVRREQCFAADLVACVDAWRIGKGHIAHRHQALCLAIISASTIVRTASSILNGLSCAPWLLAAPSPADARRLRGQCPTDQYPLGFARAPRTRGHAADGDPCVEHRVTVHLQRHCRRGERKGIGLAVPYFVVGRRAAQRRHRHANAKDQVARREHRFNVGRATRLAMKVFERYRSLTVGTEHINTWHRRRRGRPPRSPG